MSKHKKKKTTAKVEQINEVSVEKVTENIEEKQSERIEEDTPKRGVSFSVFKNRIQNIFNNVKEKGKKIKQSLISFEKKIRIYNYKEGCKALLQCIKETSIKGCSKLKSLTWKDIKAFGKKCFSKCKTMTVYVVKHTTVYGILYVSTLIWLYILSGYAIYSFAFEIPQEEIEEEEEKEEVVQVEKNYFVDTNIDKVNTEHILWGASFDNMVERVLKEDNYIKLKQISSTNNYKGNQVSMSVTTNLELDFFMKRFCCTTELTDSIGTKTNSYFYDNTEPLYLIYDEENGWVKNKQTTTNLSIDINEYDDCFTFYKYLLKDFQLENYTMGIVIDDYIYFENVRPSEESDLTNVSYDTLGDTKIQLIFKRIAEDKVVPVTFSKQIDFEKNDNNYYSKLVIMLEDISDANLDLVEYVELEDEETTEETMGESKNDNK